MTARNSWSAKADPRSDEDSRDRAGDDDALPLDDLLEARFDDDGRLSQIGRGEHQRIAERLDPRPPAMGAEELERAVRKLAQGLESIERQGSGPPEMRAAQPRPGGRAGQASRSRDFVTSSLDRLESRLESLSKRLQNRSGAETQAGGSPLQAPGIRVAQAAETTGEAQRALAGGRDPEAWQSEPSLALPESRSSAAEPGLPDVAAEPAQGGRTELLEARRLAVAAGAHLEAETARMHAEQARIRAEAADAMRRAEDAEILRQTEAAGHRAELAAAQKDAENLAIEARRQFAAIQSRIEGLQQSLDGNQIEPVRREMLALLKEVQELGRDGRAVVGAVGDVRAKLDDMETKLNAARNMTGNRLGELQDRLATLNARVGDMEAEVPGFDAVRESQTAILERFDRMEGLVHRLVSPEDLLARIESMRQQLQGVVSQPQLAELELGIRGLSGRMETLPETLADRPGLERIEGQLDALASEFVEARRHRIGAASDLDSHLVELSARVGALADADHTVDLSGVEERLSSLFARLDEARGFSGDALGRLEARLEEIAAAVEKEEEDATAELLAGLARKIDVLGEAIDLQDARGARRDVQGLDRKLDQLASMLADQAEHLSRPQMEPLEERLDRMQAQLEDVSRRAAGSNAQLGPFAEKLQEIAGRLNGPSLAELDGGLSARLTAIEERLAAQGGKTSEGRSLHNQLEGIVSRLELLKGRSLDPARLTELFDRLDAVMRATAAEDRFDRLERKLDAVALPPDRLDQLERRLAEKARAPLPEETFERLESWIAETVREGLARERVQREQMLDSDVDAEIPDERFQRLEQKLEEIGRASDAGEFLTPEDLSELRSDIVALRRELRSLPGLGDGEENLSGVLRMISERLERLPEDPPATSLDLERQFQRLAHLLEDPGHSRLALAHIEGSLRTIEQRLDDARRGGLSGPRSERDDAGQGDIDTVAELARALSDDVTVLKSAAEASERKTKDALEAVHGTLEAVVKRMAFIERDTDKAPPPAAQEARPEQPSLPDPIPALAVVETARLVAQPELPAAIVPEQPREAPTGGGLFSRFTSSQLLKRATGGKADSFSPDFDDQDEAVDQPLEPGTNAPLDSALIGAPSSDTALMSGARNRGRSPQAGPVVEEDDALRPRRIAAEPAGDDFLMAARRAAQAAAAEAVEAEREAEVSRRGLGRLVRPRRRAVLAAAVVLAVAFAAVTLLRKELELNGGELAGTGERPTAAAVLPGEASTAAAPEPEASPVLALPGDPVPDIAALPEPSEPATAETAGPMASSLPEPDNARFAGPEGDVAAGVLPEEPGDIPAGISADTPRPVETASLPPPGSPASPASTPAALATAADEPATRPDAATAPPSAGSTPAVPEAIQPERLRAAAVAGDPLAAFEVAARLAEGRGTGQDLPAAVSWYERAANGGLAPAAYRLGSIYEKGMGVPKDLASAMDWYTRASDAGNVKAMHNLAVLYAEGAGGTPDLERAAELFRQAAEHGVRDSQFNLAILHARGLGVSQDMNEAYKWFAIAASSGDPESLKRRDIIAAALPEAELAEAQAEAAAFQPLPLISEANDVVMPEGGWGGDAASLPPPPPSDADVVALVQKLLADQGYDPGPPDGVLGDQTVEAITSFQEQAGLPETGQIDSGLVAALQEESS